jgi:hypothetical protein
MPNEAEDDLDSEAQRRIMLLAGDLAFPAWEKVEKAYARGLTLPQAKQSVLEAEIARLAETTEERVLERLVQLVMQTPATGLRPAARRHHRKVVLARLEEPYREAGGSAPGAFALWLYGRFGIVPGPIKTFWARRGERLGRVL